MVKQITKNKIKYYLCQECDFVYKYKKIAIKYDNECKKYPSGNMKITKYAFEI